MHTDTKVKSSLKIKLTSSVCLNTFEEVRVEPQKRAHSETLPLIGGCEVSLGNVYCCSIEEGTG